MSFYWFGDSWVTGDELTNEIHRNEVFRNTYAYLVSQHFGTECKNHAVNATGIPHLLLQLKKIIHNINQDDTLFFGLSGSDRFFTLTERGMANPYYMSLLATDKRIDYNVNKLWYKYFDSVPQRNFVNCNTLDLLKAYCDNLQVKCFFYNI